MKRRPRRLEYRDRSKWMAKGWDHRAGIISGHQHPHRQCSPHAMHHYPCIYAQRRWVTVCWALYRMQQDIDRRNTMKRDHYRAMIVRAVEGKDEDTIGKLVDAIRQAESAKSILRQKGWGSSGMTIEATARLVPLARD